METRTDHKADTIFIFVLFAVFTICAFTIVMIGAEVYQSTTKAMSRNYEKRIGLSYVSEKIRQWDQSGSISVGSFHGKQALILEEEIEGKAYQTFLYCEKGAIRELMVRRDIRKEKLQGEKIADAKAFQIQKKGQVYNILITGKDGNQYKTCIYQRSRN